MAKSTNVAAVDLELKLNSSNYDKQLNNKVKGTESAFSSSFGKIGALVAGAFAVKTVANFTKKCIDSASKVQSAFTGLNSIVQGTGNSFSEAQDFIKKYTADGLVSIEETATAYKNLLSRGYDTSQIEDTLTRLKDSAAFGRQASYDLGEAVVTATEGLKNENSILVDNAGVTKNVAKMWEEYAKSVGKSSTALTQQEKIQAEYKGIMNETKFQVGDAANYTKTFAGQIQQLKFNFNQMTVAIGKVVTPIAQLFIPVINTAITAITKLFEKIQVVMSAFGLKMPNVISKTTNSIAGVGESSKTAAKDAVSSAKKMNKAFSGLDEIHTINNDKNKNSTNTGGSSGTISNHPIKKTENPIDSALKATSDNIKKYIEPLTKIDFGPLINSFKKLKKSLEPFNKSLFKGLEWFYFNILVPFAEFSIEKLIPSFLNLLSGAIDWLGGAIDYWQPQLEWLWDNFLKPLAKWTGDEIVDTLNTISKILSKIGKFAKETAPEYDKATKKLDFSKLKNKILNFFEDLPSKTGELIGKIYGKIAKFLIIDAPNAIKKFFTETVPKKWEDFKTWLSEIDLKEIGKNIIEGLWEGILGIGNWIKEKWNEFKEAFVKSFKEAFEIHSPSKIFKDLGKNIIEGLWEGILSKKEWFKERWEDVKSWFSDIAPKVQAKWETTKQHVSDWYSSLKSWWGDKKLVVKNKFETTKEKVSDWWSNIKSWWGDKSLSLKIKIGEVTGSIKKWLNTNFVDKVNKKLPSFFPKIPKLAQGGYAKANNPQLAIIGDNKREGEIVSPESKIYEQTLKAIKDSGTNGKQEIEITIYHKYEDGKTIIQKINQAQIDAGKLLLIQ